jgi:hypothetical protein
MTTRRLRSYTELVQIHEFQNRFRYLRLHSQVGVANFGFDRYLNQAFYTSSQWRRIRNHVIARDMGRDLGIEGHEIFSKGAVHHMNPMQAEDLVAGDESVLDPEFLITVSLRTHNAIHFGDEKSLAPQLIVRRPGDTKLWLGVSW